MPYAVEMSFDESAESRIREMWSRIAHEGISSLHGTPFRPHVSLTICDEADEQRLTEAVGRVAEWMPRLEMTLGSFGRFTGEEGVAFLAVVPTSSLLARHSEMHDAVSEVTDSIWAYYSPGNWVPHCTLGMGISDAELSTLIAVCRPVMPVEAVTRSIAIVEVPTGRDVAIFNLRS